MNYKLEEIYQHFLEWLCEQDKEWVLENWEDLHHHCYNMDYYIIGRYQATKWLGEEVFNVIDCIKEYEQENFGSVSTDFSEPEHIVNMYVYIIGERVVSAYQKMVGVDYQAPKLEDYKLPYFKNFSGSKLYDESYFEELKS